MTAKIAVLAPIPSASAMIAVALKLGDLTSCRKAYRKSGIILKVGARISSFPNSGWECQSPGNSVATGTETEFRRQVRSQTEFGNEERYEMPRFSFRAQCFDRVHFRGAVCREKTGDQCDRGEQQRDRREGERIVSADIE
jgi:hypothetical protein